jgi:hypothetical protein
MFWFGWNYAKIMPERFKILFQVRNKIRKKEELAI